MFDIKNWINKVLQALVWKQIDTSVVTFTQSSGSSSITVNAVYVNINWLIINVKITTSASISAGSNVWVGTFSSPYTILTDVKDVGYSSSSNCIMMLGKDGSVTVRNTAASLSSGAAPSFTLRIPISG